MILFKDATANGDYNEIELNGAFIGILQLDGVWDGATVTLKGKTDEARVRIKNSGYTNEYMFSASKQAANAASSGTDFIYNAGEKIEAQTKVEGAGPDNMAVWFKVQEI